MDTVSKSVGTLGFVFRQLGAVGDFVCELVGK